MVGIVKNKSKDYNFKLCKKKAFDKIWIMFIVLKCVQKLYISPIILRHSKSIKDLKPSFDGKFLGVYNNNNIIMLL